MTGWREKENESVDRVHLITDYTNKRVTEVCLVVTHSVSIATSSSKASGSILEIQLFVKNLQRKSAVTFTLCQFIKRSDFTHRNSSRCNPSKALEGSSSIKLSAKDLATNRISFKFSMIVLQEKSGVKHAVKSYELHLQLFQKPEGGKRPWDQLSDPVAVEKPGQRVNLWGDQNEETKITADEATHKDSRLDRGENSSAVRLLKELFCTILSTEKREKVHDHHALF